MIIDTFLRLPNYMLLSTPTSAKKISQCVLISPQKWLKWWVFFPSIPFPHFLCFYYTPLCVLCVGLFSKFFFPALRSFRYLHPLCDIFNTCPTYSFTCGTHLMLPSFHTSHGVPSCATLHVKHNLCFSSWASYDIHYFFLTQPLSFFFYSFYAPNLIHALRLLLLHLGLRLVLWTLKYSIAPALSCLPASHG